MSDNYNWSTFVGRWKGIPLRIHLLLFLFIACIFGAEWNYSFSNANFLMGTAMVTMLVLVASILLHEAAHIFALHNLGGHVNSIVFMPWGGNSEFVLPQSGRARALIYLAGPFVNGMVFLLGMALLVQSNYSSIWNLINPLDPHRFNPAKWPVSLTAIITWINFQLMLVNLIPCYPFDGAALVRSWIAAINLDLPKYRIESAIKVIGNAVAFAFIGMAWFVRDIQAAGPVDPTWLLFLLTGIVLLYSSGYSLHIETSESESVEEAVESLHPEHHSGF